jgi:hypothetical protein
MCVPEQISGGKVSAGAAGAHFFHKECLGESYEAVMICTPDLQYKCGRSTEHGTRGLAAQDQAIRG